MRKLLSWSYILLAFCFATGALAAQSLRITHVIIYDGSGAKPYAGEVRVESGRIISVGRKLKPQPGETLRDGGGLALSPGFIDMHTHADRGIFTQTAENVVRQGITTVLVGQDGFSQYPLQDFFHKLEALPADKRMPMNLASMAGQSTLREQVMGKDLYRPATADELKKMSALLENELAAGAFGLSTGLEYAPAHFSTTEEVVELSKVAAAHGGFYISHVRDEGDGVFKSFDEIIEIGRRAHIPVEITHIKLAAVPVWHQAAKRMPSFFARARSEGVDLKADVYPYTYWQSTLLVIVPDMDFYNASKVEKAIAVNGGPAAIRISEYTPEPAIAGMTLDQVAARWKMSPVEAFMKIARAMEAARKSDTPMEANVIVTSMSEDDLAWFAAQPRIMFCTDGELHGLHPRGAGSFPRVLGRFVREKRVASLPDVIRRMAALPAQQLGLKDRGRIAAGYRADLVLFDPATVADRATVDDPEAPPVGIAAVMVNGQWVVENNKMTGARPGEVLRKTAR